GQLIEVEAADLSDEGADLAGQLGRHVRYPRRDDFVLPFHRRVIDPEIETATLEGIVDLARPVRGDDDGRRLVGLDRADLGNRDLEVGEQLEQEGLELIIGTVDFVDEQNRWSGPLALDRLQQRTLDQELMAVDLALGFIAFGAG